MRVVLALDKFKGTLSAQQACELLAEGIRKRNPKIEPQLRPMADGGEGTAAILSAALGMETMRVMVPDLMGREVEAVVHWQNTRRIALIESASVLGVERAMASEEVLMQSSTQALGRLLQKALDLRPSEVWIGVGGTLTADAGWGLASLFGLEARDAEGNALVPCLNNMDKVASLHRSEPPDWLHRVRVTALCDVNAPAVSSGPVSLASFLEQKGAKPNSVAIITERIQRFWTLLQTAHPSVLKLEDASTGAGGGLCLGLSSILPQFRTELGARRIARATALAPGLGEASLAVCGEGCLDEQTLYGKAPAVVAELAQQAGIPVIGVFGRVKGDEKSLAGRLGVSDVAKILPGTGGSSSGELVRLSRTRLVEIGIDIAQRVEATDIAKRHGSP